jgi:predicted nucleic acid-binding protein
VIIADTGFFVALANRKDRHHAAAVRAAASLRRPPITTWPVLTETCHLLADRLTPKAAETFIASGARGEYQIFSPAPESLQRVAALMKQYQDLPMDLADASLVLLAEHLGTGKIFSTDRRDFGAYRWKNRHPFENLLLK